MAIETKEPAVKAPWPPQASNDPLYRYPDPNAVGKEKGESFSTIAKKHKIAVKDRDTSRNGILRTLRA
jgi:hypothetical protein